MNDKLGDADVHSVLGHYYRSTKRYTEARDSYESALDIIRDMSDYKYQEAKINSSLGRLYFEIAHFDKETIIEDNYKKSAMYFKKAIEVFDLLFQRLPVQDDFKIPFRKELISQDYNILTEVLIEIQQIEEAILVSERGRGRSLSDLLVSRYFISRENAATIGTPFLDYDELQEFLQRSKLCILFYTAACRCIIWVLFHNQPVRYHIHHDKHVQLFLLGSRSLPPELSHLPPTMCEAYIEMFVDEAYKKMKVREAVTKCENRSLDFHDTHISRDEGEGEVVDEAQMCNIQPNQNQQFLDFLSENCEEIQNLKSRNPMEKLFDILITPIKSDLIQDEIVIIPQGPVFLVPFAALRDPETGLYFYQTKQIRLAPSITFLKSLQECPVDYHSTIGALVIGNPNVAHVMFKGNEQTFCPLPSAEREADDISRLLGVTALTGSQATKQEVKDRLAKGVSVIHIAAHADSKNGEIALAPSESARQGGIPKEEDYLLTMKEVQEIGVRAKLVVLSCCHSGRGDIEPEGVVGMSRAFLAAGARAVIASLWAVDDFVTFSFMMSLYSRLKRGRSASLSLQQAMDEIRKEGYANPKYWAPFYLIGDDITIT